MIPSPLKAANLKIATLTILLQEARNGLNAAAKFERLGMKINSGLKTGTDT